MPPFTTGIGSNITGALAYPLGFITGIIFLVKEPYKYDPFVRFHAFQSIFISIVYGLVYSVWSEVIRMLFGAGLGFIAGILAGLDTLVRVAGILLVLFVMYKAIRFERFSMPIVGQMAALLVG